MELWVCEHGTPQPTAGVAIKAPNVFCYAFFHPVIRLPGTIARHKADMAAVVAKLARGKGVRNLSGFVLVKIPGTPYLIS